MTKCHLITTNRIILFSYKLTYDLEFPQIPLVNKYLKNCIFYEKFIDK